MDDFSVLHSTTLMNHQEILSAEETNETIENSVKFVDIIDLILMTIK